MIFEVCAGSYQDVLNAKDHCDRIELNQALYLGGLTPSLATFLKSRVAFEKSLVVMVRPRGGGFAYSQAEIEVMLEDAKIFLEYGADGIVFGILNEDYTINLEVCKQMVTLIHAYGKEAIFHRAIDVTKDYMQSIEQLIELKVDRILTSGHAVNVEEGLSLLKLIQQQYGEQIQILAGCGVRASNIQALKDSNITQIHGSCKDYQQDVTSSYQNVSYDYDSKHIANYEVVNKELVKQLNQIIKKES